MIEQTETPRRTNSNRPQAKSKKEQFKDRYGHVFSNLKYLKTTEKPPNYLPLELKTEPEEFENEIILEKLRTTPVEQVRMSDNYIFGNYDKYYNYRYVEKWQDPRLKMFNKDHFFNKEVLDIGCNDGSLTIMIAIKFFPKKIVGLDIDYRLINKAIQNVRYLEKQQQLSSKKPKTNEEMEKEEHQKQEKRISELMTRLSSLPKSFMINMGAPTSWANGCIQKNVLSSTNTHKLLDQAMEEEKKADDNTIEQTTNKVEVLNRFPDNVNFRIENVIKDMGTIEKYDTVTCFSTSKWIHLNWGDCGIRRLFKKVHNVLRPRGIFVFEPQDWRSYKKRKYMSKDLKENYKKIQMKPNYFENYLVQRLGFTLIEKMAPPSSSTSKSGFKRTIFIYRKD